MEIEVYKGRSQAYNATKEILDAMQKRLEKLQTEVCLARVDKKAAEGTKENLEERRKILEDAGQEETINSEGLTSRIEKQGEIIKEKEISIKGIFAELTVLKNQMEAEQNAMRLYIEKEIKDPKVAKCFYKLLEEEYTKKKEEYEKEKDKALGKQEIIGKIKNDPGAQKALGEILELSELLKLRKERTKLEAIVNGENADKNSKEYQDADSKLKRINKDTRTISEEDLLRKKDSFVDVLGGFDCEEEKKKTIKEVLEDFIQADLKVDEEGKVIMPDMLEERQKIEGDNIKSAEEGISFNTKNIKRIQKIIGKGSQQVENIGQAKQGKQKKQGIFKRFFKRLFAKQLPAGQEEPEPEPEPAQEDPYKEFADTIKVSHQRGDAYTEGILDYFKESIEPPKQPSNQENDGRGGRE